MNYNQIIKISDSLFLDRVSFRDTKELVRLLSDPVFSEMTRSIPYPYTTQDAKAWIHSNDTKKEDDITKIWSIRKGKYENLCGMVGVYRHNKKTNIAEIGYWVGKEYWGHGVASDSVSALLDYVKSVFGVHRFIAHTFVENPASGRVLEKNNFTKVKVVENYLQKDGENISAFLWEKKQ